MLSILVASYIMSTLLEFVAKLDPNKTVNGQIHTFVRPKLLALQETAKTIYFRKHFAGVLKLLFLCLLSFYFTRLVKNLLYRMLLAYIQQQEQLERLGEKFHELIIAQSEKLAEEMVLFLKYHNLRDRLNREQWVDFFKQVLLDPGTALKTFQELLSGMVGYAIKADSMRIEAIRTYGECLVESLPEKTPPFPRMENDKFLRSLKKINQKFWSWSFYDLQQHLKNLLELYKQSEYKSKEVRKAIECLKRELRRRASTW
jgi:tetratricopeptide (TPR) repeat protein